MRLKAAKTAAFHMPSERGAKKFIKALAAEYVRVGYEMGYLAGQRDERAVRLAQNENLYKDGLADALGLLPELRQLRHEIKLLNDKPTWSAYLWSFFK